MEIKVCGPGCANCSKAESIVKEAVADAGINARVIKISDFIRPRPRARPRPRKNQFICVQTQRQLRNL